MRESLLIFIYECDSGSIINLRNNECYFLIEFIFIVILLTQEKKINLNS